VLAIPLVAAALNAALVIVEEANLWMPFGVKSGIPHHLQCNALIGNPNELGAYLGVAALALLAAVTARRRRFDWMSIAAVVVVGGLLVSQTLTAALALSAALLMMFARSSPRHALRAFAVAAVAIMLVLIIHAPFRTRAANMLQWARSGNYNLLVTERLTAFTAASMMFSDHPLTGAGPGTFAWHYYDYKLRAEERYPSLRSAYNRGMNFGEVHNDHLQVLAETGAVGFAMFVTLLVALAALSFGGALSPDTPRSRFAWRLALPLAIYWAVLSLAQFPLETTAVRALLVHLAALCVAWRSS
jgi:O-antigen ligase